MHEWGDSGITAVLLALVVAVLISVGVAQQARARAARCQEIRRLQLEAAQEAQRVEAQAAAEYKSMVATRNTICAICYNTSNTRCSRCKSVRYCSAACQTLHWKQGHKQVCRAPDPQSSGSSIASSRNFSDVFSRSSSTSESRTLSEVSDFQGIEDTIQGELPRSPSSNGVAVNGATANGALPKPKKVLFPYKSFVRFFNNDSLRVPPCGLINCGNSCFANVVLQCLTYTRPLTAYLLDGSHGDKCTRSDWCFMCELQDHVYRVRQEQNAFSPIRILSRIRNIGNHLGYGRQEDAHEFMRFAIDSMQSTCLDEAGGEKSVDPRSQETTLIHHIFGGHLQSQVKCMQCLHESNRYEKMMDLAVEIHGSVETLEDALAQFTAPEWLDGDNKYKCDRCNAYVKARKRLTLHEAPNILTIALKRFQSGKFGKLNKRVTFPEELDMIPYMSGKGDRPPSYLLYAVVVHVDMLNASFFGHYICYVRDSQGIWYKIDDSKVKEVDIEKVMSQRAYMLFYTRSAARPAPEVDDEVLVVNPSTKGRPVYKEVGVVRAYTEASHLVHGVMPVVGGTMGLHAMVEPRQRDGYVEGVPQTVKTYAFVNGEHAPTQPNSWERDIMCVKNDDEISVEESGCVASSSSYSVISPTSSSHLSTEEPGVLRKILVCNPPGSSTEENMEFASSDLLSPMSSDLADITLKVSAMDKPLTPKIGKRRLDDELTPLPAPKPLDTDQLPAWPSSSNGRSLPSTPVCLSAANQVNGMSPNALSPPRQKYIGDKAGEPARHASPVQPRISSDQIYPTASAEPGCDPERIYVDTMNCTQSAGAPDEDLVGRAKRQHVEFNNSERSLVERVTRSSGMAQAPEQLDMRELDRRDRESNHEFVQKPGSPASVAISAPFFGSCADVLPADTNHYAPSSEVQSYPSSLRQVLLDQQVKVRSTQRFPIDETLSNLGVHPLFVERAGVSLEGDFGRTMQQSPTSSVVVYQAPGGSESVDDSGVCKVMQCDGAPGIEPLDRFKEEDLPFEDLEDVSMLPLPNGQPADRLQPSEIAPQFQTCEVTPLPVGAPQVKSTIRDGASISSSKQDGSPVCSAVVAHLPAAEQDTEALLAPAMTAKVERQRSTLKPLFTPGFLNKVTSPVLLSRSRHGSGGTNCRTGSELANGTSGKPYREKTETSGNDNGVENGHADLNGPEDGPSNVQSANDQWVPTSGASNGDGNKCLPAIGINTAASSSASHLNGAPEEVASPCGNGGLRNSVKTDNIQGDGEVKSRNKAGGSSKGKRSAAAHVGNGTLPARTTEEQATHTVQVTRGGLARPASGKQKQGRNESCHCGSQRKWKKCCGRSEGMTTESSKRRLVI